MTVSAINAELADMVRVTERDRLDEGDVRLSDVGRTINHGREPAQSGRDEDGAEDRHPGDGVETSVKDLWHRCHLTRSRGKPPPTLRCPSTKSAGDGPCWLMYQLRYFTATA